MRIPPAPVRVRHLQRLRSRQCQFRSIQSSRPVGFSLEEHYDFRPPALPLPRPLGHLTSPNIPSLPRPRIPPIVPQVHSHVTQTIPEFEFKTGSSAFAKRDPRPFPPPFNAGLTLPSTAVTASPIRDAFTNYHFNRASRAQSQLMTANAPTSSVCNGPSQRYVAPAPTLESAPPFLHGITNGDDALLESRYFMGVADGVGAWNTRAQGHAGLWARLILHFWATEINARMQGAFGSTRVDPLQALHEAYTTATEVTKNLGYLGTTTACLALLTSEPQEPSSEDAAKDSTTTLHLVNIGDSQAFVLRPREGRFIATTKEQWHWFDCPRQLGTNSPDTPLSVGAVTSVNIEDGDVVLLATDGLMDNLWNGEIEVEMMKGLIEQGLTEEEMARRLVDRAKEVAGDPYGGSPYMERAVEQGVGGVEGGKWDDISVVLGRCVKAKGFCGLSTRGHF